MMSVASGLNISTSKLPGEILIVLSPGGTMATARPPISAFPYLVEMEARDSGVPSTTMYSSG